MALLTVFVLF